MTWWWLSAVSTTLRLYARGQLVKVHPRQAPGHRVTDAEDLPAERTAYALRDLDQLTRMAERHETAIGAYMARPSSTAWHRRVCGRSP